MDDAHTIHRGNQGMLRKEGPLLDCVPVFTTVFCLWELQISPEKQIVDPGFAALWVFSDGGRTPMN